MVKPAQSPMTYEHRNGETEPPTVEGLYFFDGAKLSHSRATRYRGLAKVWRWPNGDLVARAKDHWTIERVDMYDARWWGPITPPWEEQD